MTLPARRHSPEPVPPPAALPPALARRLPVERSDRPRPAGALTAHESGGGWRIPRLRDRGTEGRREKKETKK